MSDEFFDRPGFSVLGGRVYLTWTFFNDCDVIDPFPLTSHATP